MPDDVVVWALDRDGNRDLQAVGADDGSRRWITSGPDDDLFAVVSPDRRTVVYEHAAAGAEGHDLRVVGADGSGDRPLFATPPAGCGNVSRPAWSPDGELFAAPCGPAGGERRLVLVRVDGTVVRELDRGSFGDPAFTRDGAAVVYWKNLTGEGPGGTLHRVPVDGSAPVAIGDEVGNDPATSPVADVVAFRRQGSASGLWVTGLPAGEPRLLTTPAGDHDPAWSPDGTRRVFVRDDDLWVMSADGTGQRQLTTDRVQITAPAWSTR
jgi:Tol biopolymer transport system component